MSMTVAMGRGAQAGVLFRNAEALEHLREIDTVVLDKTGTLTAGRPEVVSVIPVDEVAESELLRFAASLEQASEHPLAAAVVTAATTRGLRLGRSYGFDAVPGKGATGVVQLRKVAVGNRALMEEAGVDVQAIESEAQRLRSLGQTVIYVALDGEPVGLLGLADPLKAEAWEVVQQLKSDGIDVVILSGDHEESVRAVAAQLGVEEVAAGVLPEQKAERLRELAANGRKVAMVGDGINDAPALAQADVGLAIGTGTDVAMAAAPVTLMSGDLRGVARAISLSRQTLGTIKQNLFWAFFYNVVLIPAAMLGYLNPMLAAGAMAFSSVFVVSNSLRLRGKKI
jgi:Cu+-exporting ATPase